MDNKVRIYNLIVLDESGSMSHASRATISGCNELINAAAHNAKENAEMEQYMSIYAFQGNGSRPSRYLVKNADATSCEPLTERDYEPNGMTPLLDAVGMTLSDLMATCEAHPGSIGNVTIITDGMENFSRHYSEEKIASMVSRVKEMGWCISLIGANIDVLTTARHLNIDNHMSFANDDPGTSEMMDRELKARRRYFGKVQFCIRQESDEPMARRMSRAAKGYFDDAEEEPKTQENTTNESEPETKDTGKKKKRWFGF